MRFLWSLAMAAATASLASAFAPMHNSRAVFCSRGTAINQDLAAVDVKARQVVTLERLNAKDAGSGTISADDLHVVYEDDHIVVVSKPPGILTIPGRDPSNPSLNKAVFDRFGSESGRMDKMVVHRLGMDTSGLVVFARTEAALRGMNTLFRTRKVIRKYEALVCGHVLKDEGTIDLPLMRDYENPPFMRVSTDDHQRTLASMDVSEMDKKMLEAPKNSITKYEVLSREDFDGNDVSRLTLTSISGRTHQLNVHCAAIGHPIVGDAVYGIGGEATANGGMDEGYLPEDKASEELQQAIASAREGKAMCVHAKSISFRHPVSKEQLSVESEVPF